MRRTHQIGVEVGVGFLYIETVITDRVLESADMVMGVIADALSLGYHAVIDFGIFADVVAPMKKVALIWYFASMSST